MLHTVGDIPQLTVMDVSTPDTTTGQSNHMGDRGVVQMLLNYRVLKHEHRELRAHSMQRTIKLLRI